MKILIFLISSFGLLHGYKFDDSSCETMMPKLHLAGSVGSKVSAQTKPTTHEDDSGESDSSNNDQDAEIDLSPDLDNSPLLIKLNSQKYRRNRIMTVKIEGAEFNGFLLQARNYSETKLGKSLIGTFVDLPSGIATLDCFSAPHFKVSNTAYSKNTKTKKNLELKWKAPASDVGSIEFTATIIQGNRYWTPVKSNQLLFNEFPPDLDGCGKDRSCYRYSEVSKGCETGICDYVVVSKVVKDDVIFTIGGRITSPSGYVGIGFTKDNETLSSIDMCACMKTGSQKAEVAHFLVKKLGSSPERPHVEMEEEETDVDGNFIWCKFRRHLRISDPNAADLTQSLFQLFLWGELDSDKIPILPKQEQIVRVMGTWNHTQTVNVNHYVGGASILKISWTILFGVLVATLLELYLM